jgi:hypothetical protein
MENPALNPYAAVQSELRSKLENRTAQIGIVGMGYVGLTLSTPFGREI